MTTDTPITWTQLCKNVRTFKTGQVYTYKLKSHIGPSLVTQLNAKIRNRLKKSPIIIYTNYSYDIRIET